MKLRSRCLEVLGSAVLSLMLGACGDDGSGETSVADSGLDGGLDGGPGSGDGTVDSSIGDHTDSDSGSSSSEGGAQTGLDVTLDPTDDSADAGSVDVFPDADASLGTDTTEVTLDSGSEGSEDSDDSEPTETEADASTDVALTSAPVDASDTNSSDSGVQDASAESIETDSTGTSDPSTAETSDTITIETGAETDEIDASVDAGEETTTDPTTTAQVTDFPTSDVTTGDSETYWAQSIWSGYVFPFGTTGAVTIENGTVCVAGNEFGTVGLLYNVNQAENGEPTSYSPGSHDVGVDLNIVSAMGGQVRFLAGETEYCAQAVEGETFYFWFWDRFKDCDTGTTDYDGETPFDAIAIVLSAEGEYELCVDKFNVGILPDGGVLPVDASVTTEQPQ